MEKRREKKGKKGKKREKNKIKEQKKVTMLVSHSMFDVIVNHLKCTPFHQQTVLIHLPPEVHVLI